MTERYGYYAERANKTPLDRGVITQMLKKQQRLSIVAAVIVAPMLVGIGLLGLQIHHLLFDVLAWLFFGATAVLLVETVIPLILLPLGKFTVSLDAMCRKEIVYRGSGDHKSCDEVFYFSHHGSFITGGTLYNYTEPGHMFYVVSYYGHRGSPAMIFHTHMYEWVGAPEELGGVQPTAELSNGTHMGDTILARRPLTKGRKTRLTDEEIVRDLMENRRVPDDLFAKLSAGLFVICGVLFFVNVELASVVLALAGTVYAALLTQRLIWNRQVRKHRFIITKDTLMDKDPITRGIWRWKKMRFTLAFRNSGTYRLPRADTSVFYDAELGDSFLVVRLEGKNRAIRAVYNALDYDWD
ncbi:MAG: hypothetical protein IJW40_03455 [Clostridia bacterium]|nr:hypothetical protein [Clostridia bacterium]